MEAAHLLSDFSGLALEVMVSTRNGILCRVRTTCLAGVCPHCGHTSSRVHSRYRRHVADLPIGGVAVQLQLTTRKFFCDVPECSCRIFTERLPQVVARYARKTDRLQDALRLIGCALGGAAGARLASELGLNTSPATLLRQIPQPLPTAETAQIAQTPRVLGVDDFAFRRGHTYGTILVDLEQHRVVDLLPDREAQTLADWLKQHPGVEVISRDRAAAYAQGAREGAPHALQIADRWHLLKNLTDALEKLLLGEHRAVREAALCFQDGGIQDGDTNGQASSDDRVANLASSPADGTPAIGAAVAPQAISPRLEQDKQQRRERRLARYEQVRTLFEQGMTIRAIARQTRLSRKTVRRFVKAAEFPERAPRPPRSSKLDDFAAVLNTRWEAGCHNATQLYMGLLRFSGG